MPQAAYACDPRASLGRAVQEEPSGLRSPFQRDRDRIVHCTAFRRLEYKTQVFVNFEGDHFRTRLTHSLEVAQITRTIARALDLDEDLAEAVALAHDLGHSPFGHAGEAALQASLEDFGGFDHNLQTFRIVTRLEQRYAAFDGLNLTFETLEGIAKHNGPVAQPAGILAEHKLAAAIDLAGQAPLEAQVAALADDIAYCNHDLDDGLRAGFFACQDLADLPMVGEILAAVRARHGELEPPRMAHEIIRRLIDLMVGDVLAETRRRIDVLDPACAEAVRRAPGPLVGFAPPVARGVAALRAFLRERMYHHYKVNRMTLKAQRIVRDLVEVFLSAPQCLPDRWRASAGAPGSAATALAVRDYIAGMTDRYALDEHDRLFRLTRDPS
ncbi:deoxyguanosinetriphosphate triphosphohydrolase [Geminicoccaceae bacterium 1502E]|nr:deoxyguanosinetriphosphate triphosphohydrolase [Geminicoccaceae bacterium 1502E]